MKTSTTYIVAPLCVLFFFCNLLVAQETTSFRSNFLDVDAALNRVENFKKLKELGYNDREIFEDLGNANFLAENYESAIYWYKMLMRVSKDGILDFSYHQRYKHAHRQLTSEMTNSDAGGQDWVAMVEADYRPQKDPFDDSGIRKPKRLNEITEFANIDVTAANTFFPVSDNPVLDPKGSFDQKNAFRAPIAVTDDGKTAYFSRGSFIKPVTGIFSKKELVHKIYRAKKIKGQWTNIEEVAVCPKYYSAQHPSISSDGKRLFFASNMPGSFGKYDIYVTDIRHDGSFSTPKNLGKKVNTKKNDLYPNLAGGTTLFYASEGRKGFGGLDIYMVQVGQRDVGISVNMGSPINSKEDDFSIFLLNEKQLGSVMSNRGTDRESIQQVAFSYTANKNTEEDRKYNIFDAFHQGSKVDYSTTFIEED